MKRIKGRWAIVGVILLIPFLSNAEVIPCQTEGWLEYYIQIPSYEIKSLADGKVRVEMQAATHARPGYPRLPALTYTFALPPGTEVQSVEVSGNREPVEGCYMVEARKPLYPLSGDRQVIDVIDSRYNENMERAYSGKETLPDVLGKLHTTSEKREYSLATVALYPFYFEPVKGELSFTSDVTVRISYSPVSAEQASYVTRFLETGTINPDVPSKIYNKSQAREWYRPRERYQSTQGMIILTVDRFLPYLEDYISWRESTGFNVRVVTKEEIASSEVDGADLEQKIRNWLRENVTGYNYLFIIAHHWEIPMRILRSFGSEDPSNNVSYYPHPSDIYYGDLSRPDSESWDANNDGYYGQVAYDQVEPEFMDSPDLELELHVGRFNAWSPDLIQDYTDRVMVFESSQDLAYKQSAVLAASVLFYYREGKYDGAWIMEGLMEYGVLDRSMADIMYEMEGDDPSWYECDMAFTNSELVSALKSNDVGVFVEFNHGSPSRFVRTVWKDGNEDGRPQDSELENPVGLSNGDCPYLNRQKPNTSFLLSCLCGSPDLGYPLAQKLIDYGSVGAVAHTRVSYGGGWFAPGDGGLEGLFYYVLDNYLNNPDEIDYVLGNAVDAGRARYWDQEGPWSAYNVYGHALYGDPALRHYGREGSVVNEAEPVVTPLNLKIDTDYKVTFSLTQPSPVHLEVWDAAGRKVQTILDGSVEAGTRTLDWNVDDLSSGSYFLTLRSKHATKVAKAVVIR